MTTCRDCKTEMSTKANACPKCGRVYRREHLSAVRGLAYVAIGLAVFFGTGFWAMQGCG
jgi:uncharacterized paraquat-inducible protein A